MRRRDAAFAVLLLGALAAAVTCRTAHSGTAGRSQPSAATPQATATATATAPAPAQTTPLPVATAPGPSIYDRTPGIIYEEKGAPPPTGAVPSPTHRPRDATRSRVRTATPTPSAP